MKQPVADEYPATLEGGQLEQRPDVPGAMDYSEYVDAVVGGPVEDDVAACGEAA